MKSSCPHAPEWLGQRVRNTLAQAEPQTRGLPRRRLMRLIFAEPHRANIFAVAATLAVIAGAVLFGIFGRSIDDVRPLTATELVSDAVLFAEKEHGQCAGGMRDAMSRIDQTDPAKAEAELGDWLGAAVSVFDLKEAGYEFVGAGQCGMPVPARSGHLLYRKTVEAGQRAPMLSVFIVRDGGGPRERGQCGGKLCEGLDCGKWCCVSESGVKCKHKVLRGTDGKLVYFLVCCDDRDLDPLSRRIQLAAGAISGAASR